MSGEVDGRSLVNAGGECFIRLAMYDQLWLMLSLADGEACILTF